MNFSVPLDLCNIVICIFKEYFSSLKLILYLNLVIFLLFSSHDYVEIFLGRRLARKLSGKNGRYRGGDDKRFLFQDDDDCDDDDDDDEEDNNNDDDDYNGFVADNSKRTTRRYTYARQVRNRHVSRARSRSRPGGRHGSQVKGRYGSRRRNRQRSRYVNRVYLRGTGEEISIVFKSDRRNRRKGFDAMYRVSQGDFISLF